jgi:hypothetical protein
VFAAVVVVGFWLAFFVLPYRMVRSCCLTAEQRLQAESNVRTVGVQALGGLVVLVGVGTGAYFTWRQVENGRNAIRVSLESNRDQFRLARDQLAVTRQGFEEARRLAIEARAHDREMAAEERRQERRADAYVELVEAVFRTQAYWQFRVQDANVVWTRPPSPPPEPPGTEKVMAIAAKVHAFGSPEVKGLFDKFTARVNRLQVEIEVWNAAKARVAAGPSGALPEDQRHISGAIRPSGDTLGELAVALQDRVHAELDEGQGRESGV